MAIIVKRYYISIFNFSVFEMDVQFYYFLMVSKLLFSRVINNDIRKDFKIPSAIFIQKLLGIALIFLDLENCSTFLVNNKQVSLNFNRWSFKKHLKLYNLNVSSSRRFYIITFLIIQHLIYRMSFTACLIYLRVDFS